MELPQVPGTASPESDLGLLQRGRGSGWLRAADRPDGQALLLLCLGSDPRWDHQVESRSDYYATLALRLDVPAVMLLPVAMAEDPNEEWIARSTLEPLDAVDAVLASDEIGVGRAAAWRYVKALPPEISLPLARQWLVKDDGRSGAAGGVLAEHAESSDALAVRRALSRAVDYSVICNLVTALGRLQEDGPYPELEAVYLGSAYSYARMRAVVAMAATDSLFAESWAE